MLTVRKQTIEDAYRRLVEGRGKVISQTAFERIAGVSPYYWRGGHWRSWSEFQAELGYVPNRAREKSRTRFCSAGTPGWPWKKTSCPRKPN